MLLIVAGIVLHLLHASGSNGIVSAPRGDGLVSPFANVFHPKNADVALAVNWGWRVALRMPSARPCLSMNALPGMPGVTVATWWSAAVRPRSSAAWAMPRRSSELPYESTFAPGLVACAPRSRSARPRTGSTG